MYITLPSMWYISPMKMYLPVLTAKVYPLPSINRIPEIKINKWLATSQLGQGNNIRQNILGERFQIRCGCNIGDDAIVATLHPTTWESAIASRCCLQSPSFLLRGELNKPQITSKRRSTHFFPDNCAGKYTKPQMNAEELFNCFHDCLMRATEVVFCLEIDATPMIAHQDMRSFIIQHKTSFRVVEVLEYKNCRFITRATYDKWDNGCCEDDEEFWDRLLCEREAEILELRDAICHQNISELLGSLIVGGDNVLTAGEKKHRLRFPRVIAPTTFLIALEKELAGRFPVLLYEFASSHCKTISAMAASLQVVFEEISLASADRIRKLLMMDLTLSSAVVAAIIKAGAMKKDLCPLIWGITISNASMRVVSKAGNPVGGSIFVDAFLVRSPASNLRGCCMAVVKYIKFLRDQSWNCNDQVMILCVDSVNSVSLEGVIKGTSSLAISNRHLLRKSLQMCGTISRLLVNGGARIGPVSNGNAFVFVFCMNGFVHSSAVRETKRCFALAGVELSPLSDSIDCHLTPAEPIGEV